MGGHESHSVQKASYTCNNYVVISLILLCEIGVIKIIEEPKICCAKHILQNNFKIYLINVVSNTYYKIINFI